jgi:imidazole glycerol phosphate synthase subunit HisF
MQGYNLELIGQFAKAIDITVIANGGRSVTTTCWRHSMLAPMPARLAPYFN